MSMGNKANKKQETIAIQQGIDFLSLGPGLDGRDGGAVCDCESDKRVKNNIVAAA